MDITAVVVLNETPPVTAAVAVDETTLQATVNPSPGGGGGNGGGDGGASLSDATPQPLGAAAAGTASTASRSDHRHAMPTASQVGADSTGTATAAVAAHAAAADAHSVYTTRAEAAAAAPVQSVSLSAPSGWSASTTNTDGSVSLTLGLPTGFSLPSNTSQANWDTAYSVRLQWSGGATGLNASTGRASLELGSAALAATTDFATPSALTTGLAGKADLTGPGGTVPSSQLPGFVDDVLEFDNFVAFPLTGETGKLYVSKASNRQYRWSGTVYVEIIASPGSTDAVPEGSVNLYFTSGRGEAAAASWWAASASKTKLDNLATVATSGNTGDLSESGGNLFFTAARALSAALTGFTAGAGTVAATDSILAAFQKVVGNIAQRAIAGAIGGSGLTMATARILGRSAAGVGAPEEFGVLGLAFSGTNLATLADAVIGLTSATAGPTATGILRVIGDFPYDLVFTSSTAVPVFFCDLASLAAGSAIELDIRISLSGVYTSIYATSQLPRISVGANTSRNVSGGTFSAAFINGTGGFTALTIPTGASVRIQCTQFPSGGGGAGLTARISGRRAS